MLESDTYGLESYLGFLRSHPVESQRLANSFLINVTHFFRDPPLFDYLARAVLPELSASARERGDELRMWSAGCATGEEAYSLAMLVAEALGDDLADARVRIFATDIDSKALAFARQGLYPAAALKRLSSARRDRFFAQLEGGYEVRKPLRRLMVFGQHDLAQRSPFPRIDLILCRNVLIYFAPELQRRALQLFAFSLRDGGRLILGKSETANPLAEYFAPEDAGLKVYCRQGKRILIPRARQSGASDLIPGQIRMGAAMAEREARLVRSRHQDASRMSTEGERRAMADLPIGLVVVDRNYDVQAINPSARRLLNIHTAALGVDFVHLAQRIPSDVLRAAINAAFRGQSSVQRVDLQAAHAADGAITQLDLGCYPHLSEGTAPGGEQGARDGDGRDAACSARAHSR
jgi:two-component system CheB/CheR fusion protein